MDERPEWTPEQLEALESLRCEADAENDPALASTLEAVQRDRELAQRLERIRDWDGRVAGAIREVCVPPGLAEQILQRLEPLPTASSRQPESSRVAQRRRRFSWPAITVGVGVAAMLVAVATVMNRLPEISSETLLSIAQQRFLANQDTEPAANSVTARAFPTDFPYSPELFLVPGTQWRSVPDFDRAAAIAYDIPLAPGQKATLYVIRCRSNSLGLKPPLVLAPQTRNLAIAAWRTPDLVYIVVVEGGEPAYRALLQSTSRPLT